MRRVKIGVRLVIAASLVLAVQAAFFLDVRERAAALRAAATELAEADPSRPLEAERAPRLAAAAAEVESRLADPHETGGRGGTRLEPVTPRYGPRSGPSCRGDL
jgi:hypothetical protein